MSKLPMKINISLQNANKKSQTTKYYSVNHLKVFDKIWNTISSQNQFLLGTT